MYPGWPAMHTGFLRLHVLQVFFGLNVQLVDMHAGLLGLLVPGWPLRHPWVNFTPGSWANFTRVVTYTGLLGPTVPRVVTYTGLLRPSVRRVVTYTGLLVPTVPRVIAYTDLLGPTILRVVTFPGLLGLTCIRWICTQASLG